MLCYVMSCYNALRVGSVRRRAGARHATEGGAFIEQLVVALRRGGIGAMMLRTVRRSGRAAGGRVELQVHDKNHEARRYYRRLGNASNTVVGVARRALEGRRGGPMRASQGLQNHASGWGGA